MPSAELKIVPVETKSELKQFIGLPHQIYQNDPHWIAPLNFERKRLFNPKKNPFFQHAQVQLFLAKRNGEVVGRISAQIDEEYEKRHGKRVGHFGFFESENNPETARVLFEHAEDYLKKNRAVSVTGPFNFSINGESGLLVEGFDQPLTLMMPYNPPYYEKLIEENNYQKCKDLYAWNYLAGDIPDTPLQLAAELAKHPDLTVRPIRLSELEADLEKIMDIFNSAWANNWGFVPLQNYEVKQMAKDLKLFIDPKIALIAEIKGEPAAMCLTLPNFYEYIRGLNGKLFPLGFLKLLWRIKRRKCDNARLLLLGIKKEFRQHPFNMLSMLLYTEIHTRGKANGYMRGELSWTLEDNTSINQGIELMGGKRYKTYRIYEKEL
ncbi:MAG: N-acetyltransferase [Deltaproteobacteria bacterium]|nr:N-acetyltransferase [Deltaproteobacteria bacterium]